MIQTTTHDLATANPQGTPKEFILGNASWVAFTDVPNVFHVRINSPSAPRVRVAQERKITACKAPITRIYIDNDALSGEATIEYEDGAEFTTDFLGSGARSTAAERVLGQWVTPATGVALSSVGPATMSLVSGGGGTLASEYSATTFTRHVLLNTPVSGVVNQYSYALINACIPPVHALFNPNVLTELAEDFEFFIEDSLWAGQTNPNADAFGGNAFMGVVQLTDGRPKGVCAVFNPLVFGDNRWRLCIISNTNVAEYDAQSANCYFANVDTGIDASVGFVRLRLSIGAEGGEPFARLYADGVLVAEHTGRVGTTLNLDPTGWGIGSGRPSSADSAFLRGCADQGLIAGYID